MLILFPGLSQLQFMQTASDQKTGAGKMRGMRQGYVGILVSLPNMRQPSLVPNHIFGWGLA